MPNFATALTGEAGETVVAALVIERLGWCPHSLGGPDVGIDLQIEVGVGNGDATGRLLGVQVKAGPTAFKETVADGSGWVYRADLEHLDYWLNYDLPVLLVLCDTVGKVAYWQHITSSTAVDTGKGFKIFVPKSQRLDADSSLALAVIAQRPGESGLQEFLLRLPPSCAAGLQRLDQQAPTLARRLARALVGGRAQVRATVTALAADAPDDWPYIAWIVLSEYMLEYDEPREAAVYLTRADRAAPEQQRGRWAAFAGVLLAVDDPDRARELLTEASGQPGGRLLGPIGLAGLEHGADSGPVPIPQIVRDLPDEAERDPSVQRFLADQAQRAGDLDAALTYHEKAFALAPQNTNQQLALADVLLRRPDGTPAVRLMSDYRRAANLASAVRTGKRRWLGDSIPAAVLLQAALILAGDSERAFALATAQADGEATAAEAASPRLAMPVAKIAYEQGRPERAAPFAAVVDSGDDATAHTLLAAVRARAAGDADQEQRWREALAASAEPGARLMILGELADLGCWPLGELDLLRDEPQLRPGMYELLHARALVGQGDTKQAQALLRRHLATTGLAVELYVSLLVGDGKIDEAVAACDTAAARFGDSRPELQALDVLDGVEGRTEQLLARAAGLLSRSGLPYSLRRHVRRKILAIHTERRDWASTERLCRDGMEEVLHLLEDLHEGRVDSLALPASAHADLQDMYRDYTWQLILQQFNRGHGDRALATFEELRPEIREPDQAQLWLDLHRLHGWTSHDIERAAQLTEQRTLPEQLTGQILFTLLQASQPEGTALQPPAEDLDRIVVPGALYEQITAGWHAHRQRRTAAEPNQGQLDVQQLRDRAVPYAAREARAIAAVWDGKMPAGAVSMVAESPYLLALAERRARILPVADPNREIYQGELQAAAACLGEPVSIETSALFVCAALLEQWPDVHPEFSSVLLAERATHDIMISKIAAQALGGNVGYFGIDPATGVPVRTDLPAEMLRRVRRHTGAVYTATQDCEPVHQRDLSALGNTARDINGPWPWLACLALAIERSTALYSDDASLRALARAHGVPAFGTLALLETLGARREPTFDPGMNLAFLFAHHAVDLPDIEGLVHNALNAGDAATEPVLINLARPHFWQAHNHDYQAAVASTVAPAYRRDPASLASLALAIVTGATEAFTDPMTAAAATAATILTACGTVTRQNADIVVPIVRTVAAAHGVDPIARLRQMLIDLLTAPRSGIQLSERGAIEVVDHALRLHDDSGRD